MCIWWKGWCPPSPLGEKLSKVGVNIPKHKKNKKQKKLQKSTYLIILYQPLLIWIRIYSYTTSLSLTLLYREVEVVFMFTFTLSLLLLVGSVPSAENVATCNALNTTKTRRVVYPHTTLTHVLNIHLATLRARCAPLSLYACLRVENKWRLHARSPAV